MVDYQPKNFFRVVVQLQGSVVPILIPRILLCVGLGAAAAYGYANHGIKLPSIAHTLLGVALGLLLVFRTNASYDRFWEGRRLFGSIINRSRDILRQTLQLIEGDSEEVMRSRREIRRFVLMYYGLLRQYLRAERNLDEVGVELTDAERAALEPAAVRPNLAVVWMTDEFVKHARAGRLSEQRLQLIDQNLTALVDYWGGCERIMRTPVPFAYAQHIKSFLTLFCLSAPFAMVESMKWYTPIAAGVLAYGMFGIDEIGVEIEDPFGDDPNDLPIDAMGKRIADDTAMMLDTHEKSRAALLKAA
ncbi:Putative membrane protein [Minicystis rosea]|nr:Putative membrane protein [Minicystis rosea]